MTPLRRLAGFADCDSGQKSQLIPLDVALSEGLALAEVPVGTEEVSLEEATGRVLSGPCTSPIPLPPFDNAAMDGYAVATADFSGPPPWVLPVSQRLAAGVGFLDELAEGTAARIFTGAPVPPRADAVVMQEHVRRDGDAAIFDGLPPPGLNTRRCGEDLGAGDTILSGGILIGPRETSALASIGAATVSVRKKLRVALFSTGTELVEPGAPLAPGQIWNSNRFMLKAALAQPLFDVCDFGAVPDDPVQLVATLKEAAAAADMVLTTGGVSVGEEDHMPRVVREAGGDIRAMRVAMKPGKPLTVGTLASAIYLGLPGNPVSAFITWFAIGAQIAARRAGLSRIAPRRTQVGAAFELTRRPGRCEFRPARIVGCDDTGREAVELLSASFSARVALLAEADGLVLIAAETERIEKGEALTFLPL